MSFAKTLNIQVDVQVASPTCAPPQPLRSSNYPAKWWDIEENQSVSIVLIQSWLSRKQNTQTTYILAAATRSRQVRLSSVIRCEVGQKSVGLILARNTVCCTSTNVSYYRRSIVVQKVAKYQGSHEAVTTVLGIYTRLASNAFAHLSPLPVTRHH